MTTVVVLSFLRAIAVSQSTSPIQIDINSIAKGRSNIYSLPGRTCSDGSMYAYVVTRGEMAKPNENGKFEKVMVTFQDGGACFDYPSCSGKIPEASYTNNFEGIFGQKESLQQMIRDSKLERIIAKTNNCMLSEAGLLPCSSTKFADYVSLLIPYCTGDVHIGTQTVTYYENETTKSGGSLTIRHHGALHVLDLLPAFVAATGSPSNVRDLIVSGGSAGGWAGMFWGGAIMEAFERTLAPSFRGKLRTHVLVDSAFQVPLDDPTVVAKVFRGVKWGDPTITWRDELKPIQPTDLVNVLKQQLRHYAGRFRMAFIACNNDAVDEGYADYIYPRFGVPSSYSRVAGMWKFLGDIHRFDATLGSDDDGSDSRVFSFIADCEDHILIEQVTVHKKVLIGNERAPYLGHWVQNFLSTGFPFTISPKLVRVGGPSYTRYRANNAAALKELKADRHADKYWCCVRNLDDPGTTYQKGNFLGFPKGVTIANRKGVTLRPNDSRRVTFPRNNSRRVTFRPNSRRVTFPRNNSQRVTFRPNSRRVTFRPNSRRVTFRPNDSRIPSRARKVSTFSPRTRAQLSGAVAKCLSPAPHERSSEGKGRKVLLHMRPKGLHAKLIRRPSLHSSSPYDIFSHRTTVADVQLDDGREVLALIPSFYSRYCKPGVELFLQPMKTSEENPEASTTEDANANAKYEFKAQLVLISEPENMHLSGGIGTRGAWVGAQQALGEKLTQEMLKRGLIKELGKVVRIQRQVPKVCGTDLRVDFVITNRNGTRTALEVKPVIDTDYDPAVARPECDKDKILLWGHDTPYRRAAVYPREERAVGSNTDSCSTVTQHVDRLIAIQTGEKRCPSGEQMKAAFLFLVVRKDAMSFRPNWRGCPTFVDHLRKAKEVGVKLLSYRVSWELGAEDCVAYSEGALKIDL